MHRMTGVFAHLSVCRFCDTLVYTVHILSNKSQIFRRNLLLDILERKEEKMMPPHRASGVYCCCYNEFTEMYVYKTKF